MGNQGFPPAGLRPTPHCAHTLPVRALVVAVLCLAWATAHAQLHKRDSLFAALKEAGTTGGKIETLTAISQWNIRVDFRDAVSYAKQAMAIADTTTNLPAKAVAFTNRALVYWYNGEYGNSIDLNKAAIAIRKNMGDFRGTADNYQKIAMNYYYMADYERAIEYFQLSLAALEKFNAPRQLASTLNQIALVYNKMGKYDMAAAFLYEFSKERMRFKGYQGRTYNLLESTPFFRSREYFQIELDLQLKALNELERKGSDIDILFTCLNIADSYRELGKKALVLSYLKKANTYYQKVNWMTNHYGLGNAYLSLGQVDSAIEEFRSGIKTAREKGTRITLMAAYQGLGKALVKNGHWDEGLQNLKIGLAMTSEMGNRLDMVLTQYLMAEVYEQQKNWDEALSLCNESIGLAKEISAKKQIVQGLQMKSEILRAKGDYRLAYDLYKEAKIISDSLITGEADFQFAQQQAQLELDKKTKDIRQLNLEKEMQTASIRNKNFLIIGITAILVLSMLLAVSTFLRYRQKAKANKVLQHQKRQIEMLLSEVHHRIKNNLQVISSLLSIQSGQLQDANARMAVIEGQNRVQAMGLIHENIYKTENFSFIEMEGYLDKMGTSLMESFGYGAGKVKLGLSAEGISLDVDTAIHIGLIINELMTNSLKHAFHGCPDPRINVKLWVQNNGLLALEVQDNGRGFAPATKQNSFGLQLVKELASQMDGTVGFRQDSGLTVSITLSKFKMAA